MSYITDPLLLFLKYSGNTSTRPQLIMWIQSFQFYSRFRSGELPIHCFAGGVAAALPRIDFPAKGLDVRNPSAKTLFGQNAQFDFGGVKPASVFGRIMDFQSLHIFPSL